MYAGNCTQYPQLASVLFEMTIDLNTVIIGQQPFAHIKQYSFFKEEDEILFSMATVFHIESIEIQNDTANIWYAKLTLTNEKNVRMEELDEDFCTRTGKAAEADLGKLLLQMEDNDRAIDYCKILLTESPSFDIQLSVRRYNIIGECYKNKACYELALQIL
ncbi:unnamed protein product [Didymodactylos carnosus]|uniref:Uncharacterized protein n=1 Tax=Didymodactylos carnosus TaxID=1234261 RepID=A0A815YBH8_9BILA|nr:unnamed protein product [Didymodactylos carnosus]CAF1568553.1 unnamed protein product [Didymodactylos carnosus]CAF4172829.1 unnamed protein product [Didymodactylos carnosus]CAF4431151.1 unnamed protein product [Didymodactylos carnosus]